MIQTTQGQVINKPVQEGKVRVWYTDGTPHDCWPVDAREMVEGGSYSYEPPEASQEQTNDKRELVDADEAIAEAEETEEVKPKKRSRK